MDLRPKKIRLLGNQPKGIPPVWCIALPESYSKNPLIRFLLRAQKIFSGAELVGILS